MPTALKSIRGTTRVNRTNPDEPAYKSVEDPPSSMSEDELKLWNQHVPILVNSGVMSENDSLAMEMLCKKELQWRLAESKLDTAGMVVESPSGYPIVSPWVSIARDCYKQLVQMQTEFGMTPSSRTRVKADKASDKKNPFNTNRKA